MSSSQNLNIKVSKRTHFLDHVLLEVIHSLDRSLSREQTLSNIKGVLEKNNNSQKTLFDQLQQQDSLKYSVLLGFIFKLGIGVGKDEEQAFEHWKKDTTPYGNALVGNCY